MSFKFHKIKTVLKYLVTSWPNSKSIVNQSPKTNRIMAYFSLLYWYYFYGNDFNDYCTFRFWEKTVEERKSYISLRRNDILRFKLSSPEVHRLFLDKAAFNKRFSKFINRKWILAKASSETEITHFINRMGSVIAKPLTDFGGHGIIKIDRSDNANFGNTLIKFFIENDYIIEECIENTQTLKQLAPGSLNTIRIVTLIDKSGLVHILAAVLRMGNGKAYTDNYHDGGLACAIDIENGTLKGKAFGMSCVEFERHPYSNFKFDGYYIPEFRKCLELVEEIVRIEPSARYVGWDFAITPNGIELLEGNIPPGEDITQIAAGRGLWYDVTQLI